MEFVFSGLLVFILIILAVMGVEIEKNKKRIRDLEMWVSGFYLSQKYKAEENEKGGANDDSKRNRKKG